LVFAVGAVVFAVWDREETEREPVERHPPTTTEERAAAAVAIDYVRAAQRGDVAGACEVVARDMARRVRCRTAGAEIPRDLRNITRGAPLRAVHARLRGDGGTILVESPSEGQQVDVIVRGTVWRVVRAEPTGQ